MFIFKNLFSGRTTASNDKPPLSLKKRFEAMKNIPAFFRLVWKTSPGMTLANIVLRVIKAALPLLMLYVGKLILDEVVFSIQNPGQTDFTRLWWFVGAEFALAFLSDLLGRAIALLDGLLGDLFANYTSIRLMEHAAALDLDQFEDAGFYDKLERARRQTLGRSVLMSQLLSQFQDVITVVFLTAGLVAFNPWLLVLLALAVIPAFLGEAHFNERSYSLMHGLTPERRELDYLRMTGASNETAKEVKIFGLSDFLTSRYRTLSEQFYTANRKLSIKRASWGTMLAAFGSLGYYIAYVVILLRTINGQITIGELTFLAGSFARLRGLLEGILNRFSSMGQGALYLNDLFEFFEITPAIVSTESPVPFPKPIQHGFVFENVGFKYTNTEKWAVRNLNFHLKPGEKLALVGENGAGKTTLVKLLARLYEPSEGRILLDGIDLREYDLLDLRSEIGVIFQDFVRFQLTAGMNIAIGRIEDQEDREQIELSAERSLAKSVIDKLPEKYDQMIGRKFAKGVDLSGGEWQKIALGRAYMRNAQLLILDEPTAALDARAEHEVFLRFAELTKGKSAVLISHRFSTVRMADRIMVLENGEMLEMGSHEELLEKNGRYAELFRLQARGYL